MKVDKIAWCRQSMKRLSLKRKLGAVDEKNSTHQVPATKQKDTKLSSDHLRANARPETKSENAHIQLLNTKLDKTQTPVLLTKLPPFPPFSHHQDLPKVKENERNSVGKIVGRNTGMLSPFPPMCSSCRKRKPMSDDFLQNIIIPEIKNDNNASISSSRLESDTSVDLDTNGRQPSPQAIKTEPEASQSAVSQCPMCGKSFGPSFTMLDVDSHLANCLSATDDDVQW